MDQCENLAEQLISHFKSVARVVVKVVLPYRKTRWKVSPEKRFGRRPKKTNHSILNEGPRVSLQPARVWFGQFSL